MTILVLVGGFVVGVAVGGIGMAICSVGAYEKGYKDGVEYEKWKM